MNPDMSPDMSEPRGRGPAWPLGTVTVLGAHILDVLGRPVEEIPPGQGSVRLKEIRATAAGTAAGPASTWPSWGPGCAPSARSATTCSATS